jgi:hypothetical protein
MRSVISHGCRQGFALDHDDFGFIQSKIIVIESKSLQRDAGGKPGSIFPHPALAHFPDARRNAPRRETHRPRIGGWHYLAWKIWRNRVHAPEFLARETGGSPWQRT